MTIIKRIAGAALTLLAILTVSFILIRFAPGSPLNQDKQLRPEITAQLSAQYGLDKPVVVQYLITLGRFITVDFGPSISYPDAANINALLAQPLRISLTLGALCLLFAMLYSLLLTATVELTRSRGLRSAASALSQVGVCVPVVVLAPLLILLFSLQLGWLPPGGFDLAGAKVLPVLCGTLVYGAVFFRLMHGGLQDTMARPFIFFQSLHGLPRSRVLLVHAARPALFPFLSMLGPAVSSLLTGSLIIERLFNIPGISSYFVNAIHARDYPLIMAITFIYALILVSVNLIGDSLIHRLNPGGER